MVCNPTYSHRHTLVHKNKQVRSDPGPSVPADIRIDQTRSIKLDEPRPRQIDDDDQVGRDDLDPSSEDGTATESRIEVQHLLGMLLFLLCTESEVSPLDGIEWFIIVNRLKSIETRWTTAERACLERSGDGPGGSEAEGRGGGGLGYP